MRMTVVFSWEFLEMMFLKGFITLKWESWLKNAMSILA